MRIMRTKEVIEQGGYYTRGEILQQAKEEGGPILENIRNIYDDLFSPYAWPGSYSILFTTDNGDVLCAECARELFFEEKIDITVDVYWEGPTMYCDGCGEPIESAYGDPDNPEE